MTHFLNDNDHPRFDDIEFGYGFQYDASKLTENYLQRALEMSSSPSSYNCPSKQSYDYHHTSDFDGSDRLNEDERGSNPKSPPLANKNIQKHHEPIVDNGCTYRYEDDPHEYKRARKRVQNRISATRVRNKKKTYVEELECQVTGLKEEISQLKTTNNVLSTENSLLKQQVSFFEKLFTNKQAAQQPSENVLDTSHFSFNETETEIDQFDISHNESSAPTFYRAGPGGRVRKHTAFLGVMTILLCMYGAFTAGEEMQLGNIKSGFLGGNNQVNAYSLNKIGARSFATQNDGVVDNLNSAPTNLYSILALGTKIVFILVYVLYAIYVLQKIHRHYFHNKTATL